MAIAGMDDAVAFFRATGALGGDSMNRTSSTDETSGIVGMDFIVGSASRSITAAM